jgi:hypothetical protein
MNRSTPTPKIIIETAAKNPDASFKEIANIINGETNGPIVQPSYVKRVLNGEIVELTISYTIDLTDDDLDGLPDVDTVHRYTEDTEHRTENRSTVGGTGSQGAPSGDSSEET